LCSPYVGVSKEANNSILVNFFSFLFFFWKRRALCTHRTSFNIQSDAQHRQVKPTTPTTTSPRKAQAGNLTPVANAKLPITYSPMLVPFKDTNRSSEHGHMNPDALLSAKFGAPNEATKPSTYYFSNSKSGVCSWYGFILEWRLG
jgi:hypothetical protein